MDSKQISFGYAYKVPLVRADNDYGFFFGLNQHFEFAADKRFGDRESSKSKINVDYLPHICDCRVKGWFALDNRSSNNSRDILHVFVNFPENKQSNS